MRVIVAASIFLSIVPFGVCQEPSLGDVARATRNQQARSGHSVKVFSNEENGPSEIRDGEDPLDVYKRARLGLLHDTAHHCEEESSGNSGPGWKKTESYEVGAADRMRMVAQEGSAKAEWLLVSDSYYLKQDGANWRKLTTLEELAQAQKIFPVALIPQELQFSFGPGELKLLGEQTVHGLPAMMYRFVTHSSDMDRTVNLWIGKGDSLPYKAEMHTETRSTGSPPVVWEESTSCTYGLDVKIEPPL